MRADADRTCGAATVTGRSFLPTLLAVPIFICPSCGRRSAAAERTAGFSERPRGCPHCGSAFVFELLDDYYPAPNAAFFILDRQGRLLGTGKGARELTGLGDLDVIGRPAREVLGLRFADGDDPIATALEWGVRVLGRNVRVHAEGDQEELAVCDVLPAYDDDGGALLILTPTVETS